MADEYSSNIEKHLEQLKDQAVNRLVLGVSLLAIIGVPISVSRALYTGWLTAYSIQLLGLIPMTAVFLLRHRLSTELKVAVILGVAFLVATAGLLIYGIFGNGVVWAVFCLILCFFLIEKRTTLIIAASLSGIFFLSMYLFVFAGRQFPGDTNVYISSLSSWGTTLFGAATFIVLIGTILVKNRRQTNKLLLEIELQRQKVEHLANHDMLTELPTLRLANEHLEAAISMAKRSNHKVALLFLDLDAFKIINDTYGHDAGDIVLKKTAKRIQSLIRECDIACRVGGDEFIVILNNIENEKAVKNLCERLIEKISTPVTFDDTNIVVGISIGIAIYPDTAIDMKSMKIKADRAMYNIKQSGKNDYYFAEN